MKAKFLILRTFLILGLILFSVQSFAQQSNESNESDEYVEESYDEQTQDGGEGMACDDPSTVGEANRSAEENACWDRYARGIEDGIRRQREESEEWIRRHDESMRRSERRGRERNGNGRFGRDFYDW